MVTELNSGASFCFDGLTPLLNTIQSSLAFTELYTSDSVLVEIVFFLMGVQSQESSITALVLMYMYDFSFAPDDAEAIFQRIHTCWQSMRNTKNNASGLWCEICSVSLGICFCEQ